MRPSFLKGLACALLLFMMLVVCSESKKGRKGKCRACEKMEKEKEKAEKNINVLMESCKPVPKQIQQLFSTNIKRKWSSRQIKNDLMEIERRLKRIVGKKCMKEIRKVVMKFYTKMIVTKTTKTKIKRIIFKKTVMRFISVKKRTIIRKTTNRIMRIKKDVTKNKKLGRTMRNINNARKQCALIPPKCEKRAERVIRWAAGKVLQNSGQGQVPNITRKQKESIVTKAQNILENEPQTLEEENEEDEPEPEQQTNKILAISEPQSLQRPPAPPIPIPTTIITLLEMAKKSIEDFFTEQEDDKEMDTRDFETFVLIITNYWSALEEAVISVSNNDEKKVQQLMKDYNNLYRTKLIEILNNPSENGRQLLNYVFSYENLKTTDYIINFIWQMIEETVVNEDDPDQPESQEIFDSNTLILCEEENLAGIACYYVDVTKSCITDKENKKVLNVENMKIKSIFAPQGMYLTIKKKEKGDLRRLRGPHVWSHQNLFDGAEKIIIQTQEQFLKTNPSLRMNELDFYFINFRTTTNKEDKVGKNVTNEDSKTKNGPFGDWTDTISKHSICVRGRKDNGGKKIIKGVPVDESSINIYVPDGVRVKLKNTQCRNKGINKKEEKKENVTTIKGPQVD
uniref:Cnidarian restricted protein n=1 Tax=Clytia hemisphaerica TaxID=252671 RepID=A0A7M5U2U7_9CNID